MMTTTITAAMNASLLTATSTTVLLVGVGCFAMGYLLAAATSPTCDNSSHPFFCRLMSRFRSVFKPHDRPGCQEDGCDQDVRSSSKKKKQSAPYEIENLAEILEDFKMVLVVRNDLKMGKGKIAAQCSHATLGLYKKLLRKAPKALNRWETCGQVKVVLKSESEEDLLVLQERAKSLQLPTHITIDAGRTQIAPNSRTVMAILGPDDLVDDVTGGLKLL